MPLIIPQALPAYSALEDENIFVMHSARARSQDIRPLRILLVNLMPTKIATETQIARMLANTPLQVELSLLHMGTHESAHVSEAHLASFYKTFEQVRSERFDGMIVTGAPVELLEFEQVDYWPELCAVFEYSKTHVYSTVHICWGAQAALYYHYGIHKRLLPEKLSGVFEHTVVRPKNPLVRGFDEVFYAPHSRHTELCREEVEACGALRVLTQSGEAGLHICATDSGRQIFVSGHMEYDRDTLRFEYERDIARGLSVPKPKHYFTNDDPHGAVCFCWRSHANLFFSNWLNYYVYQSTPFDLAQLPQ
ncbi:MAG: homoserine O-succinyltransferase [Butyricicoccus sp.]|nr:homoserine O-succinyltransferase [Butyricicoccus sp.]